MKTYYFKFGASDGASFTGLSPTLSIFSANGITPQTAPGITETPAGSGIYSFQYGPTVSICFKIDGGATLSSSVRFIYNALDPLDTLNEAIGTTASSFGSTSVDPSTLFGYMKRLQEHMEGNATYTKSTGILDIYSRGSSTLLVEKTLVDNSTTSTKS